jgi:hypothetical protein
MCLAVAVSGNRWQMGTPRKRPKQAKTVATGCDQFRIGAHLASALTHPAHIPREGAGNSRPRPVIPASPRTESPALARNPRLLPLSPELPRPACHAGGRGFESRRSRKVLQIGHFCCLSRRKRPPASTDPAHIPHGNPRSNPARAGNSRNPWAGQIGRRSLRGRVRNRRVCRYFVPPGNGQQRPSRTAPAHPPNEDRIVRLGFLTFDATRQDGVVLTQCRRRRRRAGRRARAVG